MITKFKMIKLFLFRTFCAIFSRSFETLKKYITFLFLIVVEKSP